MTTETKRDLAADLALCDAAITGPVEYFASIDSEYEYDVCRKDFLSTIIASVIDERDARMITEAYAGWPHAIRRAMAAEAEVERLKQSYRRLHAVHDEQCARSAEYYGEIERLRAENERVKRRNFEILRELNFEQDRADVLEDRNRKIGGALVNILGLIETGYLTRMKMSAAVDVAIRDAKEALELANED